MSGNDKKKAKRTCTQAHICKSEISHQAAQLRKRLRKETMAIRQEHPHKNTRGTHKHTHASTDTQMRRRDHIHTHTHRDKSVFKENANAQKQASQT